MPHLAMSAKQRDNAYCDAVFELLLSLPEQSMDLATLGMRVPKPSKKASSRSILAGDPRFNVIDMLVTLADGSEENYDDSEEDGSDLPVGDWLSVLQEMAQGVQTSGAITETQFDLAGIRNTILKN